MASFYFYQHKPFRKYQFNSILNESKLILCMPNKRKNVELCARSWAKHNNFKVTCRRVIAGVLVTRIA